MESLRKRSAVWNFFRICDENTSKATCNFCKCNLSFKGGSTRNLLRHLKVKHPGVQDSRLQESSNKPKTTTSEIRQDPGGNSSIPAAESSDANIQQTEGPNLSVPTSSKTTQGHIREYFKKPLPIHKSKQLDDQLIKMIAKEYHPFSLVEDREFKQLLNMLNPGYTLPSRKTISTSLIPQTFERVKISVKQTLQTAKVVSLTTDGWTSFSNQAYIAVTAHYISDNCTLVSHLLECFECSGERHTAEYINNELKRIVDEWGIAEKVCAIVTDNAANVVAAVRKGNWQHIPCFAHTLNLIVQKGLKSIEEVRVKVKSIVEFFKRSPFAMNKLLSVQKQMEGTEKKLIQDVATRWNSTYDMFQRTLDIKEPLLYTLAQINSNLIPPNSEDFAILEKACEVLKVFAEVTEEVSAEKHVSLSKVLLFSKAIKKYLVKLKAQPNLPLEIINMICYMQEELANRLSGLESKHLYAEASLLDPRFKKHAFGQEGLKKTIDSVSGRASRVTVRDSRNYSEPRPSTSKDMPKPTSLVWDEFDLDVETFVCSQNSVAAGIQEVDKYLLEPYIDRQSDPLKWWEGRKLLYPRLFEIMKRRLCIPASSVPCERIFSKAGQILTERRNRLSPQKVSILLFLNSNL